MPTIEIVCARCGTTFVATRKTARYCGQPCRQAASADRRRRMRAAELIRGPSEVPGEGNGADGHPGQHDDESAAQKVVAQGVLIASEQPPDIVATRRGPLAASGAFIVIPPIMLALGLLLVVLGQLAAGLIELAAAIALFTGLFVWGSRHK